MQPEEDSLQRQRDLLRRRLLDSLLRQVLQVALQLELALVPQAGLLLRVHLAVAAAVLARDLWQEVAELPPDSSAPAHRDSCHRLPAVLVPEAELAQTKPTRTRVKRDR
jgi:hypothetical protein